MIDLARLVAIGLVLHACGWGSAQVVAMELLRTAAGQSHSLTLMADGTVWAWGGNALGQLGDGTTVDRAEPFPVRGVLDVGDIAAGWDHSLAVSADGRVWSWGGNEYGQLGDGSTADRGAPALVPGLEAIVAVAAGIRYSLALAEDGTVWAWGRNDVGQLGVGTGGHRSAPTPIVELADVTALSAGGAHALALLRDGTVRSWGLNASRQLGDGRTADRRSPVPVPQLVDVVAVSAGTEFSMALLDDGTVRVWGDNSAAQMGLGHQRERTSRVQPEGLAGVAQIRAGHRHALAITEDGALWAWGVNTTGQLGDGTTVFRTIPVHAGATRRFASVATGSAHTLAITLDGLVMAWGANDAGQVGDASGQSQSSPVHPTFVAPLAEADAPSPGEATADAAVTSSLTLDDGSVLAGTVDATGLAFAAAFGEFEIALDDVVAFGDGVLELSDGTRLVGSFVRGTWTITASVGTFEFDAAAVAGWARSGTSSPLPTAGDVPGTRVTDVGLPTEADAAPEFQARVDAVFGEGMGVVSDFAKVDGLSSVFAGVEYYELEFTATVTYPRGVKPECSVSRQTQMFSWSCYLWNSQVGPAADFTGLMGQGWREIGESERVSGSVRFQKSERGWRTN